MSDDAKHDPVPLLELNEMLFEGFKQTIHDVTLEESEWRPLPQANNIAVIVRHLRIEAAWHLACLERGQPMPMDASPGLQQEIDAVPLDFEKNRSELFELFDRFLAVLRGMSLGGVSERTSLTYGAFPRARSHPHMLGYHQAIHVAMHGGQIRTIRTLYLKTRGEDVPARYYPGNVSYPQPPREEPR